MSESFENAELIQIAADIVAAFVSNNAVRASELPSIIEAVHLSLSKTVMDKGDVPVIEARTPAVPVKKSITDDFIICLEDGKKFKSLKRHLSTAYNMSPDEYRLKWGLGRDYPMVAPAYASARSNLARQMGLGRKREEAGDDEAPLTGTVAVSPQVADTSEKDLGAVSEAPKKRGRPRTVKVAA